jgi:hypothetical protein
VRPSANLGHRRPRRNGPREGRDGSAGAVRIAGHRGFTVTMSWPPDHGKLWEYMKYGGKMAEKYMKRHNEFI